ncbi:hydrogenase [Clostridia bacterium]|nr:hydrogenase [Clostridia bacterium]
MVNLTINDQSVSVSKTSSLLDAIRSQGISIPSLCYLKDLNEIGACRVCVVEVQGTDYLVPSCNTPIKEGMVVYTHSEKAMQARKTNMELILSQHDFQCGKCVRMGNCNLPKVMGEVKAKKDSFPPNIPPMDWNLQFPLIRDESKCIKCMRCIQVCNKIQSLGVWDLIGSGQHTTIGTSRHCDIEETNCSLCGQCITHCPTSALRERDDNQDLLKALEDPEQISAVQISPAVLTSWGEAFRLSPEEATQERLSAVLHSIGFDYVFPTAFGVDLTINQESRKFLDFFSKKKENDLPMFSSCCPAWLRFVQSEYPELQTQLSDTKSPQQILGEALKTQFASEQNLDPKKLHFTAITSCLAAKDECKSTTADTLADVDIALTAREFIRFLKSKRLDFKNIPQKPYDSPFATHSGAGVLFGYAGGYTEALLRNIYFSLTKENPPLDLFYSLREDQGWKEAEFIIKDKKIKVAVVDGLANARKLIEALLAKKVSYDFVEVMACPGGCVGGGGQPFIDGEELAGKRKPLLYALDEENSLHFAHENPTSVPIN